MEMEMEMEMEMDKGKQIQRLHLHWHPLVLVEAQGQGQGQGQGDEKEKEKEKADDDDDGATFDRFYQNHPITVISVMSAGLLRAIRIAGNAVSLANMMSSSVPNVTTSSTSTVALKDDNGVWCSDVEVLKSKAVNFYSQLFTSMGSEIEDYDVRGDFRPLPHQARVDLMRPVTVEEIEFVFRSMDPYKAPGVDGFHACFFQ
ncbi:hypothetical protein V6N12_023335 [Hibiscus sabdariffa]|uniref:Uncharacterized protein n=1 Tax=Hibiscus sabdariffa TaxID=183260 RepID=A0ABR2FXE4_9ROSI